MIHTSSHTRKVVGNRDEEKKSTSVCADARVRGATPESALVRNRVGQDENKPRKGKESIQTKRPVRILCVLRATGK